MLLNVAAVRRGGAARWVVEFKSNWTRSWEQRVVVRFFGGVKSEGQPLRTQTGSGLKESTDKTALMP